MQVLLGIPSHRLRELAFALQSGRLVLPESELTLRRYAGPAVSLQLASDLNRLKEQGFSSTQVAVLIETILHDRKLRHNENLFDLVTTHPDSKGMLVRNTGAVVRELFSEANHSILIAGYAVYQGRQVFQGLAQRMKERPNLNVRMFLNIQRKQADRAMSAEIVRRFLVRFREREWPNGHELPELYHYPASLEEDMKKQSCLHAKCVIVDLESVFISSANFTEAAQCRNIEVGLIVHSAPLAEKLSSHFDLLLANDVFAPLKR